MSARPFLLFISRDDENHHVVKVQGDGIPLTERPLSLADCVRYSKLFAETALEIIDEERRDAKKASGQ